MTLGSIRSTAIRSFLLFVIFGAGAELSRAADQPVEKLLFEETFTEAPSKDQSWLREIPNHWKIDKERKELLISPVSSAANLANIPLWMAPAAVKDGPFAVEVHIEHMPRGDYEFAGLMWYSDDKNFVVIRTGPHGDDGKSVALLRIKDGKGQWIKAVPYEAPQIDLRMVVTPVKAEAWYRAAGAEEWQPIAEVELPGSVAAKIGLRTGNGEGDKPTWARFSKLRILQLKPRDSFAQ